MEETKVISLLKEYHQEHIIQALSHMQEEKREGLLNQLKDIDLEQMKKLYENKNVDYNTDGKITPISYVDKQRLSKEQLEKYVAIGEQKIKSGKYAFATMAGGQGTRLGCHGPKGKFMLDILPEPKSLFEILANSLKRANQKYDVSIPWYIMTSRENNQDTIEFFEENQYFGYNKKDIMFFTQNELPLISEQGKLLLGEDFLIKEAADGNGGIFESMLRSGVLADMNKRDIQWIFIGSVDNAILQMVDPLLLGLTISQNHEIASKTVTKANPHERVGVFCKKNGLPKVIEYTELSEEMAEQTDENGELLYGESHIMCNLFSRKALEKISKEKLAYHSAFKKANYLDENFNLVVSDKPNAYKFEAFIFDSFEFFDDITILRSKREEEFAPIKNKEGADSPETAKKLYNDFWKLNK